MDPDSGFAQVDGAESKKNRDSCNDLEEEDGAKSEAPHLPQVGMPGYADHQALRTAAAQ